MASRALSLDKRTWWILAAGAMLRVFVLGHGGARLDQSFVVDDAYYTLTIARSLASSGMPSVDGAELTTGFQPLLALLEAPSFVIGLSANASLVWGLVVLLLADLLAAIFLARLAGLFAGKWAEGTAAACWGLSTVALRETFTGLEAPLANAAMLGATLALHALLEDPSRRRGLLLGAALGLCLLARIDTGLMVALALVMVLGRARWSLPAVLLTLAAVAGPWLGACWVVTGRPWPESGAAVMALVKLDGSAETIARVAGWAFGFVATGGLLDEPALREWLLDHEVVGGLACGSLLALLVVVALRMPRAVRVWILGVAGLVPFYVLVLPAIWGFHRYLLPVRAMVTWLLAVVLARGLAHLPWTTARYLALAGAGTLAIGAAMGAVATLRGEPRGHLNGISGYGASARWVFATLPPGSTVAALQSGALGYFRPPGMAVANLDGVVSRTAHLAYTSGRLDEHMRRRGVTHVAEWAVGYQDIMRVSAPGAFRLEPFAAGPRQDSWRYILSRVHWNAASGHGPEP